MVKTLIILLLFAALVACAVLPGPPESPLPTPTPQADPEEEYYRGIFDACSVIAVAVLELPQGQASVVCREFTLTAYREGVYEIPTDGWRWPLVQPTPEKEAKR